MDFSENIIKSLKLISEVLTKNNIEFVLAGGLAASMLSAPRATEDIEIVLMIDRDDRDHILEIISPVMKIISDNGIMTFKNAEIWRIVAEPTLVIDFLLPVNELYIQAVKRKIVLDLEGFKLPVISIEDLILIKLLSGRAQDKMDIERIICQHKDAMDLNYLKTWSGKYNLNLDEFY